MPDSYDAENRPLKPEFSQGALPLKDQTVLVTRASGQASLLCQRLESLGANTIAHPVIQVLPMDDPESINTTLSRITSFDWIVFVSANGVRFFMDQLTQNDDLFKQIRQRKFAAIGSSTQLQLRQTAGVEVDLMPEQANSESLADALIEAATGQRVLLVRASRGSQELPRRLKQAGIEFEELAVYQSVDVSLADPLVVQQLKSKEIDWVTMTSSAIARCTISLFGEALKEAKTVSISPTTSAAMLELGFRPDAEAKTYNMDGIVEAILEDSNRR